VKRREFITLLGGAAVAPTLLWPAAARAQPAKVYTIGVLALTSPDPAPLLTALREGLRDAGYIEGRNLRLEIRTADARPDRQSESAAELHADRAGGEAGDQRNSDRDGGRGRSGRHRARRQSCPAGRQCHRLDQRRRGGSGQERGADPRAHSRHAPHRRDHQRPRPLSGPYAAQIGQAARSAGIEIETVAIRPGQAAGAAIGTLANHGANGLIIQGSTDREILELAIRHRLPALTSNRLGPPRGALMSYGSDYFELARQSVGYVDKILKGAKPADLPVAFPTSSS
jgi:putative ABC transport system substrate-binding protein